MKNVEILREDYADWDWETVELAGAALFSDMHDLLFHTYNASDGWMPFAEPGDMAALITETRGHIDRLEEAIKKARKDIADVERNARLAAMRRIRAEKKAEETN